MTDYDSNGGTPTETSQRVDYSTPLFDEVNGMPDAPDTVPWCPEDEVAGVVPMHGAGMDSIIPKNHRLPAVSFEAYTVFAVAGTGLNNTLPFPANSLGVDNYSPAWCRVADNIYVPPYTMGWVFRIPSSRKEARVHWEAPSGFTNPPIIDGVTTWARIEWYEESLAPKTGVPIATSMTLATGQASPTGTATSIRGARGSRVGGLVVTNTDSANTVYLGGTNAVTTTTGEALLPGQSISFVKYQGAVWGVTSGATVVVTYAEEDI